MLKVSESAQEKIVEAINNYSKPVAGIRVVATARSPFKVDYGLEFVLPDKIREEDEALDLEDFMLFIDTDSKQYLEEVTLDFEDGVMASGFKFTGAKSIPDNLKGTAAEKVLQVIEEKINPSVASHGGWVSLIDVKEKDVYVQLGGGCQGCGMANVTLKQGIEVMIKEAVPEIENVYDVTEHADGKNPYYQQSK